MAMERNNTRTPHSKYVTFPIAELIIDIDTRDILSALIDRVGFEEDLMEFVKGNYDLDIGEGNGG